VQHDISHFGRFKPELSDELVSPSVNVRFLGAHGWEVFVRPPMDTDEIQRYHLAMDKAWEAVMRHHASDVAPMMPGFVQLVWLLQPLSKYSAECGHVILHAYLLASKDLEMDAIMDVGTEMFMKQMVQPNGDMLRKGYIEASTKKSKPQALKPGSFEFWKELPTIGKLFPLFDLGLDL
jgi:hypothetical protein